MGIEEFREDVFFLSFFFSAHNYLCKIRYLLIYFIPCKLLLACKLYIGDDPTGACAHQKLHDLLPMAMTINSGQWLLFLPTCWSIY